MQTRLSAHWLVLAGMISLGSACSGEVFGPSGPSAPGGGGDGDGPPSGGPGPGQDPEVREQTLKFACDPQAAPVSPPLRRLSRAEYTNTLQELVNWATPGRAGEVMQRLIGPLSALPADAVEKEAPFGRMDQGVSEPHVTAYFSIANAAAKALTASGELVSELLGGCAGGGDAAANDACIDAFVERFGRRALRHRLTAEERGFYREVYAAPGTIDAAALSEVIAVMLNAPDFVYELQVGVAGTPEDAARIVLNDHEIASRLAFQFWQTAPDDSLLDAADRGELRDDADFEAALDEVLADPRAAETLEHFAREWLDLDSLRALDTLVGEPRFDAFAGDLVPSPDLRDDMIRETTDSLIYHTLTVPTSLADWIASQFSFARTSELAGIYGTPIWDGASEPPRFPEGQRAGLLTRAALLATGNWNTRPIKKGVFIRERLLCDKLLPPPGNAALVPPEPDPQSTTRETVEALTEQPGSQCATCHALQLNPLGFATEGFDALGRPRTSQAIYDESGAVVADRPVDTTSTPRVWSDDATDSSGPADVTRLVIESGKAEACFARQLVRFATARKEVEAMDGCALESLRTSLADGNTIREALRTLALMPTYRERYTAAP